MYQKTVKVEFRLTEDEKKKLKLYAVRQGKTMSQLLRELCEDTI